MPAVADLRQQLRSTNGFLVETSEGAVGWVEDVWLDEHDVPAALALQTTDAKRALLLAEDVLSVDREYRWVVAPPDPPLLELAAPHLIVSGRDGDARLEASWATTGARIVPPARAERRLPRPQLRVSTEPREGPRPLWQTIVALYASLALIVALLVGVSFLIARLVTGVVY